MQQNRNRRVSAPREATGSSRGVKPCFVYMFDSSGSSRTAAVRGQQDGSMEHRRFGYLLRWQGMARIDTVSLSVTCATVCHSSVTARHSLHTGGRCAVEETARWDKLG
jgi:hypothetical protein